jgi:hypothetical protein
MPPFQARVFWAGIGALVLYWITIDSFDVRPETIFAVEAWAYGAALVGIIGRRVLVMWRIRRVIRLLRQFDTTQRAELLGKLEDDGAQAYLEHRLAEHGEPTTIGLVERFAFSRVDQREATVAMWASIVSAVGALIPVLALRAAESTQVWAASCASVLVFLALMLWRRQRVLRRVYDVSPFGLTAIEPDGSVRRLSWAGGLTLRNRPWLRRIELARFGSPAFIGIPYSVVGFERMVELVIEKGGFDAV